MRKTLIGLLVICTIGLFGQCPYTITASYTPATCSTCCDGVISGNVSGTGNCAPSTFFLQPFGIMSSTGTWFNLCPGSYTVDFSTSCCLVSYPVILTFNSTNIFEAKKSLPEIKIYPNPASTILYISSEKYFEAGTQIEIVNYLGQTISKVKYKKEIDVSSLASGCYVLKIITSDKQQLHSKFSKD